MTDLLVERHAAHAVLTLNRPEKRNALSVGLRDAISVALDDLAGDEQMKCVVLTGSGSVFCAGFDLTEFTRAAGDDAFGRELWASSDRYHDTVLRFPLPTIAAVNGPALAGGFDLAILCDLRIASSTARFAHPERTFGDVVYGPLHDVVGGAVARELTIGGRELDAREALAVHLVGEVVAPDALAAATDAAVARLCAAPRDVLMRTKAKALRRAGFGAEAPTLEL
jgi:enoyl-CoA hydratase/carnithine racemase